MRKRYRIRRPEWDRVDLVDRGANQHAHVVIVKSDDERKKSMERIMLEVEERKKKRRKKTRGKAAEVLAAEGVPMKKHATHNQQDHDPTKGKGSGPKKEIKGQRSLDESGATISDSQSDASRKRLKDKAKRRASLDGSGKKEATKERVAREFDRHSQQNVDRFLDIVHESNRAADKDKAKRR